MTKMPSLLDMLKAGAHFGHQKSRWHPKMAPYIFTSRNGVHVIDLEKSVEEIEKTLAYVRGLAKEGKTILFVGTKRQARGPVTEAAQACGMPYLTERWIGGLLTNFSEVKVRLKKFLDLKAQFESGEIERYTKTEQLKLKQKVDKMEKYLSGLTALKAMPDALFLSSLHHEKTAVSEANRTHVPIVAVCDTNSNPDKASYIIPANDDAVNAVKMMAELVAQAVSDGKAEWEKNKAAAAEQKAKEEKTAGKTTAEKSAPARAAAPRPEPRPMRATESL